MLAIIDVEASSLVHGYPIEVGWAIEDGRVGAVLVCPHEEWSELRWDFNAEYLHGLTQELLVERGVSPAEAVARMNNELVGCKCLSDAPSHDWQWLAVALEYSDTEAFTFDLLRVPAETALRFEAEHRDLRTAHVNAIISEASRRRNHTAAGDAATWGAVLQLLTMGGSVQTADMRRVFDEWAAKAQSAMPWRAGVAR